jgi:diguanylate cyclase (GGDEF)-like protein
VNSRRLVWLAAGALLAVVGSVGSILGAQAVARNDSQRSRQAFVTTSTQVASTLQLAIQHEQDLALSAGAFVIGNPHATQTQFLQWTNSVRAFAQYPELLVIAEVTLVPASQLSAFVARELADPSGLLAPNGTFQVSPAGARPYYCFGTVSRSRGSQPAYPAAIDYCDGPLGSALLETRDSGQAAYKPFGTGKGAQLAVGTAIYRNGVIPATVQGRRDALIGWTGTQIQPDVVLATALKGHPETAVAFRYGQGSTRVDLTAGRVPGGAQSTIVDLHNGWQVKVFGTVIGAGMLANHNALGLMVAGILCSLMLGTLIYVLGTSRSRALLLVNERTDQLRYLAYHDSLTGLPNRALILDRTEQMLVRSRRLHTPLAALFLDIDDFKDINDTLGHDAGDQLLAAVATRVGGVLREEDTVGRLGGDEFVVLVEGASMAAGAEVVAERILDVLATPFDLEGSDVPLEVTASIGIAEGDRSTRGELLRDADIALYRAKAAGKHRAVTFSPMMHESVDDHRNLEVDLHHALENRQFFLLYQPTVDLSNGSFTGVEALIRWRHPERGVIEPNDFVPALESSGQIIPVGEWVLHEACRQGAAWHRLGHRITMSVNVSAVQLERDRIIDDVHNALSVSGIDPDLLILELTETTLLHDLEATVTRLKLLKALGVRLAIDDFGTGYSSLAYLRQFPIDILKLDQSFVSGIADTKESAAIVHALVQLGKVLGLETVAEGIESNDQRRRIQSEDVDIGQGFLFARPLDAETVGQLLTDSAVSSDVARVER